MKAFDKALEKAVKIKPLESANNCGFDYSGNQEAGFFSFSFLGQEIKLVFPSFKSLFVNSNQEISNHICTIFLYHLAKSDGAPLTGNWISYSNLPGGMSYVQAFRNYTSKKLQKHFGNSLEGLERSARILELTNIDLGADAAYIFPVLPKIPIALIYHLGNEEFGPSADYLFDSSAQYHLPSDCYAIICSWLTASLIKSKWFFV